MIDNLDARIGTTDHEGCITKRPALDIEGNPYHSIGTTAGAGKGRFVVLPPAFTNWALLESIKAQLGITQTVEFRGGDALVGEVVIPAAGIDITLAEEMPDEPVKGKK